MSRAPRPTFIAACVLAGFATACQAGPTPAQTAVPTPAGATGPSTTALPIASGPGATTPTSTAKPAVVAAALDWRLPEAISRAVAFPGDASIVLAGGLTATGTTDGVLSIRLETGTATTVGHLKAPVHDAGGALIGGVPAVVGGGDAVAGTTVQSLLDGTVTLLGNLPTARADLAVVDLGGVAYVVGGGTPSHPDAAVLATSDGVTFSEVARLSVPVRYPAVAAVGGSIIVVGGSDGTKDRAEIQAIDPATGTAAVIGHLPDALSHAAAVVVGGRLLVAGGRVRGKAVDQIWEINPDSGSATEVGRLPRVVSDAAAVGVDGIGYLVGGEDTGLLRAVISIAVMS